VAALFVKLIILRGWMMAGLYGGYGLVGTGGGILTVDRLLIVKTEWGTTEQPMYYDCTIMNVLWTCGRCKILSNHRGCGQ